MTTEIAKKDELAGEVTAVVTAAQELVVVDAESFGRAGEMVKTVKLFLRRVDEVFGPIVRAADLAHKTALLQRKGVEGPALEAEKILKRRMGDFEQAEAERRRLAEEAARRERERLEEEERTRVAEEERRRRQVAEDARLAEAVAADEGGDPERARALLEAPIVVEPVAPKPVFVAAPPAPVPTVEGVSFRDSWKAVVVNLMQLVRAVAAGQAPLTLLKEDQVALNGMARSLREAMNVPGVKAVRERTAAVK